jgi:hypothetical protein
MEDAMSPRRISKAAGTLSPTLVLLVKALEQQHAQSSDRRGEANALRALGELAVLQIPGRGVFAPNDGHLDNAIDEVAVKHLGFKVARKEFFGATSTVEPLAKRDEIETAANHLQSISDRAQFCAGLAFGITLVEYDAIR